MKKEYSDWTREQLIQEIEKFSKKKKYGLVWEDKEEILDLRDDQFPVLEEVKENDINNSNEQLTNILIEGDNYDALSVLNYTHRQKIDLIYIDPPYNTGNRSWKYNNDYVEKDDNFKHSKWLTFMSKRLKLAKPLLTQRGVIVVAIDDYEVHTLRLLLDEIFDENNRLGTITVVHNPRGRNDDKFFATSHEYLLVYAKNSEKASVGYFDLTEEDIDAYRKSDEISAFNETSFIRTGNNSTRETRPNLFYPIYFNEKTGKLSLEKDKDSVELLPINESNEEKTWRWGRETFTKQCDTELLVRTVKGKLRIFKKRRLTDSKGRKPKTVWTDSKYDASSNGIILLQDIFGKKDVFPYPKSLYAVQDILKILSHKDSIVLDFFAGSGTTGHAVLDLNKIDGGNRKFIICTNNEGNIATEVCYPRIKNVIQGYKSSGTDRTNLLEKKLNEKVLQESEDYLELIEKVKKENKSKYDSFELKFEQDSLKLFGIKKIIDKKDGLGGNLKYFKTTFVSSGSTDKDKINLTLKAVDMLCLREDTFEKVKVTNQFKIFKNKDKYTAVIFEHKGITPFIKYINDIDGVFNTYIFTLSNDNFEEEFDELKDKVKIIPIPESILRIYRRVFKK
jgi:adenine-specific DNA-methyltransferase